MIDIVSEPDQRRDFKGLWIPAEVVLDDNLSPFDKLLLAEIDSYDGGRGCWMAHDKFAEKMQCSTGHITNTVSKLTSQGYLFKLNRPGHTNKALRAFYSRHVEGGQVINKLPGGKKEITAEVINKLPHHSNPSKHTRSHAARPGECFGEITPSNAEKICQEFVKFTIQHRLYVGKTGSTSNGWTKDTIQKWNGAFRELLSQTDYHEVADALEWYRFHSSDEFVPRVQSAITFCQRFTDIQRAMKRSPDRSITSKRPSASTVELPDGTEVPFDEHFKNSR